MWEIEPIKFARLSPRMRGRRIGFSSHKAVFGELGEILSKTTEGQYTEIHISEITRFRYG
jgi:hypothetical protein